MTRWVGSIRHVVFHQISQVELLLGGPRTQQIKGVFDAGPHVERLLFQLQFAGLDFGEVEDVVDDRER